MAPRIEKLDEDLPEFPVNSKGKGPSGTSYVTDNTTYINASYKSLQQMSQKDRLEVLTYLYKKGFGSGSKPTAGGLEPADINRYAAFLIFSRSTKTKEGLTPSPQQAYDSLATLPNEATTGTKVTYTNKLDVASVFSQVAERDLGRKPTEKEITKFYDAYRALEAKGAGSTQEPGIQAAAESQLKTQMGGEVQATNFADYATAFQDMLRGA
jgi:hypothetical protein